MIKSLGLKEEEIMQLSDHFTLKKLLKFVFPSILMMIFTSIYGVVDGIFVSNFVGEMQFAAVNFIFPFIMILGAVGFMFGTGGSALVSKLLGEGKKEKANQIFSMIVYSAIILGIILAIVGFFFIKVVAKWMGAKDEILQYSVIYGRILIVALPVYILQLAFQSFMISAEKPQLGLFITIAAGVTNMILDALFISGFKMGIQGAALASIIGQIVGGIFPLIYFMKKNNSLLRLKKFHFDSGAFIKTCSNGSSELLSNISMSLVSMLYNSQLLRYAQEAGVSAYGVLMYVNMIFLAIFIGYSVGCAPIISYHYGAKNTDELKHLFKKSMLIISITSVFMLILAEGLQDPLARIFVSYNEDLLALTKRGFLIYSFSFLFCGINIFASSFFTALNNGLISALISFLRTVVFQVSAVLILPIILNGTDGIWLSIVVAEILSCIVSIICLIANKKKYQYI